MSSTKICVGSVLREYSFTIDYFRPSVHALRPIDEDCLRALYQVFSLCSAALYLSILLNQPQEEEGGESCGEWEGAGRGKWQGMGEGRKVDEGKKNAKRINEFLSIF